MSQLNGQGWDEEDYSWLVGTPVSDCNFTAALERSNERTINEALKHIDIVGGLQSKKLALRRQLRKITVHGEVPVSDQAVLETATRQERTTGMEIATLQQEREFESQQVELQNEKERDIAQAYETAGTIKALTFVSKVVTVSKLVQLDLVKKSKGYKGIGTWSDYCKYIGLDRASIDDQLKNLHVFGEEFLLTVSNFGVGYREMRKLRQLANDGTITLDAECIQIGEETLPIDKEHAEDIQIAIERILEEQISLNQRVERLTKDKDGLVKEETQGLRTEVKALVKEVKRLKPFDPEERDLSFATEQMQGIQDTVLSAVALMSSFIVDERVQQEPVIMGQVEGHLQTIELALANLRTRWERAVNLFEV